MVNQTIRKRSIIVAGHKTSVSLEDAFWRALQKIAIGQRRSMSKLANEIDRGREPGANLSSAIRLYVLNHFRSRVAAAARPPQQLVNAA
jgi:predicted DNA-binding ribbon-helix-helix protein